MTESEKMEARLAELESTLARLQEGGADWLGKHEGRIAALETAVRGILTNVYEALKNDE